MIPRKKLPVSDNVKMVELERCMSKTVRTVGLLLLLGQLWAVAQQPPAKAPGAAAETPRKAPVQIGETAPDFTLEDERGRNVQLAAARGKMPVVLVFYRGWW